MGSRRESVGSAAYHKLLDDPVLFRNDLRLLVVLLSESLSLGCHHAKVVDELCESCHYNGSSCSFEV